MVAAVAASAITVPLNKGDVHLSYLPMAHVYEKICQATGLAAGSCMGFYQGDTTKLVEDIEVLKPTIFVGVPRVFQRIYDRILQQVSESMWHRRKIFEYAFATKSEALKKGEQTPLLDTLVFNKIKEKLGGRVRLIVSGAAPLSTSLHEFLEVVFGCPVVQGYGLSETCASATVSDVSLWSKARGHVGYPTPCTEIRLESVPEMNYNVTDTPFARGEVCLRGPNIFSGYYKMPEQTLLFFLSVLSFLLIELFLYYSKECFTEDGFFKTGDVGQWNADGTLSIIDRKKNIFKLAQGEYVAAEKLEGVYVRSKYVGQIWVYGDSLRSWLVAIVVPDRETIIPWAKTALSTSDFAQICKNPETEKLILQDFKQYENETKLAGFERVKRLYLSPEEFTPENDLITPTMKLRRPQLLAKFKPQIEVLYKDTSAEDAPNKKIPSKL